MESAIKPVYGATSDGGYNTPYSVTVFFDENSLFEICIAALSERAQQILVIPGADLNALADVCEHPSPDVIVFNSPTHPYEDSHFEKFFARGFQRVHVFVADDSPRRWTDPRVCTFSTANMYDGHVQLFNGLSALYIADLLTCAQFPNQKSCVGKITHEDGLAFARYLRRTFQSSDQIAAALMKHAASFSGYESAMNMVQRGIGMKEERELMAKQLIANASVDGEGNSRRLFINGFYLTDEIFAQSVPTVEFIVLYSIEINRVVTAPIVAGESVEEKNTEEKTTEEKNTEEKNTEEKTTYRVYVIVKSLSSANALEYLGKYCANPTGGSTIAKGVLIEGSKFIPFLF